MIGNIQSNWDQYKDWSQFSDTEQFEILNATPISAGTDQVYSWDNLTGGGTMAGQATFDDTSFFGDIGSFFGNAGTLATSFFSTLTDVTAAQQNYETVAQNKPQTNNTQMLAIGGVVLLLVLLLRK